ncbi:hypothetical protein Rsub_01845 [Raphidocelis subcapitata]|uniref:Uncharacterized protein n=1 Tax=Raphidocelis subcapitata TaxID=307507 RepID=A0A2V0NNI1_9CHLO|nr:hypothetical protein Rsub_01845 [Raphidocelis subcapitata]|eukprot:GBF89128.1 hypothetical protein Rsub_01845 [Raphidocelis subcapitata]
MIMTVEKRGPLDDGGSRIRSCLGLTRVAGELVAIPYPVPKPTEAVRPGSAFDGTTTNAFFIRQVRAAADSADVKHKRLMPYSCWAPRNRPKETMTNVVGRRYGVHATTRTERWKGQSQVFQACAQVQNQVGLANAGIASDIAARFHKTQGIYS